MDELELKTYIGVDGGGPFMLMFGHIQNNVLSWSRLTPLGHQQGFGTGTADDASHFDMATIGPQIFINKIGPGSVTFTISGDELTLTQGSTTAIVKEQT